MKKVPWNQREKKWRQAWKLRQRGLTYKEIGARIGTSGMNAFYYVQHHEELVVNGIIEKDKRNI